MADPDDPMSFAAAIDAPLRSPSLARGLGQAGRRRVEREFSLAPMAESTLGVYREAVRQEAGDFYASAR
jgi:starch synthase